MDNSLEAITDKKEKIKPVVDKALKDSLGITVGEVVNDISTVLAEGDLDFDIDLTTPLKEAKRKFKRDYFIQLLQQTQGNISEASRKAGIDRRTIHRYIEKIEVDLDKIRNQLYQFTDERKQKHVSDIVERTLKKYDLGSFTDKIENRTIATLSTCMPSYHLPVDQALALFEKKYLEKAFETWGPHMKQVADNVGVRPETISVKCKELDVNGKTGKVDAKAEIARLHEIQRRKALESKTLSA